MDSLLMCLCHLVVIQTLLFVSDLLYWFDYAAICGPHTPPVVKYSSTGGSLSFPPYYGLTFLSRVADSLSFFHVLSGSLRILSGHIRFSGKHVDRAVLILMVKTGADLTILVKSVHSWTSVKLVYGGCHQ